MELRTSAQPLWRARTISEPVEVQQAVDAARMEYDRFEEAWDALTWLLARKGHEIGAHRVHDGIEYRLHKQAGVTGINMVPAITCLYTVTVNEVEIIAIRVSEPESNEEEA